MNIFEGDMEKIKSLGKNITQKMSSVQDTVTLNVFAQRCNLDVDTVSEILKDNTKNPGVYTIAKIADVFNCSIDELLLSSAEKDIEVKVKLARECISIALDLIKETKQTVIFDNFLRMLKDIYLNSVHTNKTKIDVEFARKYIGNFFKHRNVQR